jgi:hypothetical protein
MGEILLQTSCLAVFLVASLAPGQGTSPHQLLQFVIDPVVPFAVTLPFDCRHVAHWAEWEEGLVLMLQACFDD